MNEERDRTARRGRWGATEREKGAGGMGRNEGRGRQGGRNEGEHEGRRAGKNTERRKKIVIYLMLSKKQYIMSTFLSADFA